MEQHEIRLSGTGNVGVLVGSGGGEGAEHFVYLHGRSLVSNGFVLRTGGEVGQDAEHG